MLVKFNGQYHGPFKNVEVLADRLRCDNTDYPLVVIGAYTLEPDDSLMPPAPQPMPTEQDYITAMEALYDATAQAKRYDDRLTCALRAGYPGPFRTDGMLFATWMDECNALGYKIMGEVLAGMRPQPTVAELLAELPVLVW